MSSISGVGGYSPSPLAQAGARAAAVAPLQKTEKPLAAERAPRAEAAEAGPAMARPQAKEASATAQAEAKPAPRSEPTLAQAFASSRSVLQGKEGVEAGANPAEEDPQAGQGTASANAALQEKMTRQIVKMKDAYSHIQAHTGNTQASAGMDMVS